MTKTTSTAAGRRFASLTPDSRKAIEAAAARLDEYGWPSILERATTTAWRPSTGTPDGALLRVTLELLGL